MWHQACDTELPEPDGDSDQWYVEMYSSYADAYPKYRILFRFIVYFAAPLTIIATFYILMSLQLFISTRGILASHSIVEAPQRSTGSARGSVQLAVCVNSSIMVQ